MKNKEKNMSEYFINNIVAKNAIDNCDNNTIVPLSDAAEIEDIMLLYESNVKKINFYKSLKRKRAEPIDDEIKKLENRQSKFKEIIIATLDNIHEKSMNYPGVGRVSKSTVKEKWAVTDAEALENRMRDLGKYDAVYVLKPQIDKKSLDEVLRSLEQDGIDVPGVVKEDARVGLSITYAKNKERKVAIDNSEEDDYIDYEDGDSSEGVKYDTL